MGHEDVLSLNAACPYATDDEIEFQKEIAGKIPAKAEIVMIGAGPGVLLISMLEGMSKDQEFFATVIDINSTQWIKAHIGENKKIHGHHKFHIHYIEGKDSYDVGLGWETGIDYLIIDGDHTERGVKRDMEAWLDHVKPGGYVFFHDYLFEGTRWDALGREIYPEVQPFADKEMKKRKWPLYWRGGCTAIFRRPE